MKRYRGSLNTSLLSWRGQSEMSQTTWLQWYDIPEQANLGNSKEIGSPQGLGVRGSR